MNEGEQNKYIEDIDYLVNYLITTHPDIYRNISKEELQEKIDQIKSTPQNMISFELSIRKLLAKINDSHTTIIDDNEINSPFKFRFLQDKLYIIEDDVNQSNEFIYNEITKINGIPLPFIIEELKKYVSYNNESDLKRQLTTTLTNVSFLQKILKKKSLIFESRKNNTSKIFDLTEESTKEHRKTSTLLNYNYIDNDTLYIKYGTCDTHLADVESFVNDINDTIKMKQPKKLIFDLRDNQGGNSSYLKSLLETFQPITVKTTLVNENVFSSAGLNMQDMRNIGSLIVGQPIALNTNHFGNSLKTTLPNTKIDIHCSSNEFILYNNEIKRITKEEPQKENVKVTVYNKEYTLPKSFLTKKENFKIDIPLNLTIEDYKKIKDPELVIATAITNKVYKDLMDNQNQIPITKNNDLEENKTRKLTPQYSNENSSGKINIFNLLIIVLIICIIGVIIAYILFKLK